MKTKTIILLFIYILFAKQLWSQTPEIERLKKTVEATNGKEKINALTDLCINFYYIDPKEAIEYGKQALQIAESLKMPYLKSKIYNLIGVNYWALADYKNARVYNEKAKQNAFIFRDSIEIAKSYNHIGLVYEAIGNFDSCFIVFNKELAIYKSMKDEESEAFALDNIGAIHFQRGELKSAMTYFLDAKTLYEKKNQKDMLPYLYLKLGNVYSESKDYTEAVKWFEKCISQSLAIKDSLKAGMGLHALGIVAKEQGKYDKALTKYQEALAMIKNLHSRRLTMTIYSNMGIVYKNLGKLQQAIKYIQKSLDIAVELNMPNDISIAQVNLGDCYMSQKDNLKARTYYEKALPIFKAGKSQSNLLTTYQGLIEANNSLKDFAQSVNYYQLLIDLKDSLNKNELNTSLDSLKVKFKTEEIDKENSALTQTTKIQNKTITLQRIIMVSSFIFLILLIGFIINIVRNRKKIKKANKLLEIKNHEILIQAEEIRKTNEKLVELSEFKDVMNSFLVHDLKNPLNAIINVDSKDFTETHIETIRQSGKQMLNLVMNLLDISKYENNKLIVCVEAIPISKIINNAYNDVRFLTDQKSIRFKSNITFDFVVKVDADMIERVFINLFSNAIKFSANGENIHVFAEIINQTYLKVIIKDNGEGIPAEHIPYIFDKFAQVHAKQSGSIRSTGVGLTFCKMAIEAHSGEIGVDSIVGQGTSFWFTIPLAEEQTNFYINPVTFIESSDIQNKIQLTDEEINLLIPICDSLKKLSIFQLSDIKDILNSFETKTDNIKKWKTMLLKALSDCNEIKFNELINIVPKLP